EDAFDARRLDLRQAPMANGIRDLVDGSSPHGLPIAAETLDQAGVGAVRVHVGGVLREDRLDQLRKRVLQWPWRRFPIVGAQAVVDLSPHQLSEGAGRPTVGVGVPSASPPPGGV